MSGGIGGNNVIPSSIIGGGNSNGWLGVRGTGGPWSGTNTHWNWNWLLLKNLTSQVNFVKSLISFNMFLQAMHTLHKYT